MTSQESSSANNADDVISPKQYRSNLWRLTLAQALSGASAVIVFATGAIVGHDLAPSAVLATLPISVFVVGMAACVFPTGEIARCYGRRTAFVVGSLVGVLTGLLAMAAVLLGSFWLFCLATFFGGAYASVVMSFRFAATDGLPAKKRPQALSLVMAGGIVAGVIGPQLVTHTMQLWPSQRFAATFLAQALVALLAGGILFGVDSPKPLKQHVVMSRPLAEIALQPRFICAVICGAASYTIMNFLMTAAPLAMHLHGHSQASANSGIQWHVIAMYAPSFFTGKLISRFGATAISALGIVLTGVSAIVGLLGNDVGHFWGLLILLGVGWNFGFLGASALVLECHQPEEKNRVQSLNDFIIFALMAIGSFSSGGLLSAYGWHSVLLVSLVPLVIAIVTLKLASGRA
ncbi:MULTISPECIES: MFS transporter [unclassified Vibrio]|uniref:MFS transporter n=1 Tax=Vibrio sp. HB236076 TaxID=3232307 RepID=A0AB39H7G3_9VIBR|nr:MFS transporter [Vibrio sp. HB161653]MDP5253763.1 MFS transporter [Vibrio sp. HB161653]